MQKGVPILVAAVAFGLLASSHSAAQVRRTQKPPLHGGHWMAITGKPLAATAGAMMFQKGGNAVDAAGAMLAATCTMWDTLGWGGETQALIYNPRTKKVIGINALGVAPTGATPEFYKRQGAPLPARVRAARRRHAGHARRADGDARRVRQALAEGRARAGDPDGGRLPDRGAARERASSASRTAASARAGRTRQGRSFLPSRRARHARGAAVAGEMFVQTRPRRDAAQAGRGGAAGARSAGRVAQGGASTPRTTASTKATSPQEIARGTQEQGGLITHGRSREVAGASIEEPVKTTLQGHRRLQADGLDAGAGDAAGAEHPRELRPQGDGLQQRALHPHALSGDEPGLRRSRLLLRRSRTFRPHEPVARAAVEGVRARARAS